jgi:hypothetical protein
MSPSKKVMKNISIISCSSNFFLQARNHLIIIIMDFCQLLLCLIIFGGACIHSCYVPPGPIKTKTKTTTTASPGKDI